MVIGGPKLKLSNGNEMPQVGLGTWQSKPGEIDLAVRTALDVGYRLIDTAAAYGNEEEIGRVLHEYLTNGKLKRQDLFVTTKLWCTNNHPDRIEPALRDSLKKLQLDYVDLYLVHMPAGFNSDMSEQDHHTTVLDTWKGMEAVYEKGLAKAIGISNFNCEHIERIVANSKVKPHNLQVEAYLYFPQFELHELCKKHNISFTSYATLGSPGRVNFVLPNGKREQWDPAPNPFDDPLVQSLAKKYGKTPSHILLRYMMDRGIAVIPKSVNADRIRQNFELFDFALTSDEVEQLNQVKHRQRLFYQDFMVGHPEDPYKSERK